MNDPISRWSAINVVNDALDEYDGGYNHSRAKVVYDALMSIPSEEPERKKGKPGRWIPKDDGRFHCSMCDGIAPKGYRWDYCPYCGNFNGGDDEGN